jgi:hypothetical protein
LPISPTSLKITRIAEGCINGQKSPKAKVAKWVEIHKINEGVAGVLDYWIMGPKTFGLWIIWLPDFWIMDYLSYFWIMDYLILVNFYPICPNFENFVTPIMDYLSKILLDYGLLGTTLVGPH